MSMYHCEECDQLLDDDYHPCEEHPKVWGGLVCPECAALIQERAEAEAANTSWHETCCGTARRRFPND